MTEEKYITGHIDTKAGQVPVVSTRLTNSDHWETAKARSTMFRNKYRVAPGIYAVGNPDSYSYVFVSANYKLSFDVLRKNLAGTDCWILVLDTKGINVWCAAGKGTFGTDELVNRIEESQLNKIVDHKKLILPQLGAVGISAHEIKKRTGFSVIYGPVRADDIPTFISLGLKATKEMRTVYFTFKDRAVLIPLELTMGSKYLVFVSAALFILSGVSESGYSIDTAFISGGRAIINLAAAYLAGIVITPMLLPWIPGRSFALKGFITGLVTALITFYFVNRHSGIAEIISWFMIMTAISSFLAMNFTGSSTYTSLSGVLKEMKKAIPAQFVFAAAGLLLWIVARFL